MNKSHGAGARRLWRHDAEVSSGMAVFVNGAVRMQHDSAGARQRWRSSVARIGGMWRRWWSSGKRIAEVSNAQAARVAGDGRSVADLWRGRRGDADVRRWG
ncbi:hypothetical protein U1Q18_013892 [Sarracenia purpurea var. burkii]